MQTDELYRAKAHSPLYGMLVWQEPMPAGAADRFEDASVPAVRPYPFFICAILMLLASAALYGTAYGVIVLALRLFEAL